MLIVDRVAGCSAGLGSALRRGGAIVGSISKITRLLLLLKTVGGSVITEALSSGQSVGELYVDLAGPIVLNR
jgi:hypothetical protein